MEFALAQSGSLCRHVCRLAWVLGFTMGPFGNIERPWKPFNPILGETFEYARPAKGMKFIAEQVRLQVFAVLLIAGGWLVRAVREPGALSA